MNKHQLDRLFEEKLGAVQQEPSDKAKASFDQLLAQKHKKPVLIWWRVAAAVLLLAVSTVTYLSWPAGDRQPMTADLPEIATDPIATTTDPVAESADSPAIIPDREVGETTEPIEMRVPQTLVTLAANEETSEEQPAPSDVTPAVSNVTDIAEVASTIAVADNNEKEPEVSQTGVAENIESTEALSVELSTEVAIAANEPAAEEAPKKKRLPVTIIYKSSSADQSLIAMQDIRDDVDTLSSEGDNSLKSILQNAGNGSLFAEFKKAKEDLFNLDIPLKTKKVEN
ncbi:MAG: hypothetical protein RIF33_14730 [Cyclobacteriaceae bacterium]